MSIVSTNSHVLPEMKEKREIKRTKILTEIQCVSQKLAVWHPSETCLTSSRTPRGRDLCLDMSRALTWTLLHAKSQIPAPLLLEAGGLVAGPHGAGGGPLLGGLVLRAAGLHGLALLGVSRV